MVYQPCHATGEMSEEAYAQRVTGKVPIFWERQQRRVEFPECRVEVTAVSLLTHLQIQHGVGQGERGGRAPPPPPREAQTYRVSFLKYLLRLWCPVAGCLGEASSRTNHQINFAHHHVQGKIVILEEGSRPYPRCPQCDMFVPQNALNIHHMTIALCRRGMERKWCCLAEEESR